MSDKKTLKVKLVKSPIGCKQRTAPPCVASACVVSTASVCSRTPRPCAA